ncbi:endonuclease V [Thermococcus chitonophagus]|uniref:Endonuclease V n=1 Tax=Thermococcus chitonophagus TaxID=54262 RepID=A0A160VS13_9EURY|nr:endonuclease V [Thermococcus chitonophagus]ASJ16646.1 endonuclease V [Thermococcus chitonophagus]CUX77429.1 Endonuclease V [Thermococcus chitonophagus]
MLERVAKAQEKLSSKVREVPLEKIERIGAVDASYRENLARVGFVVCTYPECDVIKMKTLEVEVTFPYIPTFFFLRETRPILMASKGENFDVLLVEGHGKAHPRRYGLASHIGVVLQKPTIGVAKKLLKGAPPGSYAKVGKVYVSVGNLVTLEDAIAVVSQVLDETGYPKPLKLADRLSKGKIK